MKEKQNYSDILSLIENMISHINMGVIVLDNKNNVIRVNELAQKILKISGVTLGIKIPKINFIDTKKNVLNLKEYIIQVGSVTYTTLGKFYAVNIENYKSIFLFHISDDGTSNRSTGLINEIPKRDIDKILGVSQEIIHIRERIPVIASSMSNVFITGESGTGKELVAMALHNESGRKFKPFIALNCASIPENLLESELFGYVKGAFTGADNQGRIGLFEASDGGTLFLDEIGDMPSYLQVKLLRVLEQKEFTKLGSNKIININTRFIAATNKNMEELITSGKFREDLYYRLNVIPIKIAPLRERKDDIRVIGNKLIYKYSNIFNKTISEIEENFWEALENYYWPGNIRELQNTMEYVVNMMNYTEKITSRLLPPKILKENLDFPIDNEYNLEKVEQELIKKLLNIYGKTADSKIIIADKLGISRATLYRKIVKYEL
ncbi:sigma-54 interaction domain-containing protein [Fusobacterium sp. PH5-44]|uniref:sigma-54 interaction domain-containing protein n=1 Tax=unclassified Fusobacterium TaxID=2648384 RepID=UPI003D19152C